MLNRIRFPLLAVSLLLLLAAIWAGMVRLGWRWPVLLPALPISHGPLMVSGFLGTLIGLERAVALGVRWAYLGPLATALGGIMLIFGWGRKPGCPADRFWKPGAFIDFCRYRTPPPGGLYSYDGPGRAGLAGRQPAVAVRLAHLPDRALVGGILDPAC